MSNVADSAALHSPSGTTSRDPALRRQYLTAAWSAVPRILASVDRNSFGPSYGCCDRQYWHYRTAAFPSEMYQEAALPLALAFVRDLPGNTWFGEPRMAEAAVAVMRFSARSAHRDGSADDYYPNERALGAAVFSLQAQVEAYRRLRLDDPELLRFFERRANWIAAHGESGRLTNHHALAALALWRTGELLNRADLKRAARVKTDDVLTSQHDEGWFPEYDGADPGYQTVTIDCLAKLRREAGWADLTTSLEHALDFLRWFGHRMGGVGGEYGSRGTRHFYSHGIELLAGESAVAAELADGYLHGLARGSVAEFGDDRMYVHRTAGLIEAYDDWSPTRPDGCAERCGARWFPGAGLLSIRDELGHTVVSTARGGAFQIDRATAKPTIVAVDAGLVVELQDGRVGVSQTHDRTREVSFCGGAMATLAGAMCDHPTDHGHANVAMAPEHVAEIVVRSNLRTVRFERVTPLKQSLLHLGMQLVGSWGRDLARRLLQRRVIDRQAELPIMLERCFRFERDATGENISAVHVVDRIELTDPRLVVRRLALASDLQAAYTAASQVYSPVMLVPWHDLAERVDELNRRRCVEIERSFRLTA